MKLIFKPVEEIAEDKENEVSYKYNKKSQKKQ